MVKGLLHHARKEKLSLDEVRRSLRKEYLAKAQELGKAVSSSKTEEAEEQFLALSGEVIRFFREFFVIRYEPTNEELIEEMHSKRLKEDVRKDVEAFLREMSSLKYSQKRDLTRKVVREHIDAFVALIDRVYEAVMHVRLEREKKRHSLIAGPREAVRNFSAGLSLIARWARHGGQLVVRRVVPGRFLPPEMAVEEVMGLLADSYEALEDGRLARAEKNLSRIEKRLSSFTLDDRKSVEGELAVFRRELAFAKEQKERPHLDVPESSMPEPPKGDLELEPAEGEEAEAAAGADEGTEDIEQFIRVAREHDIAPDHIRQKLLENGWPEYLVDRTLRRFKE